jgi:hypothetical protein
MIYGCEIVITTTVTIVAGALRKRDSSYVYVPSHRVLHRLLQERLAGANNGGTSYQVSVLRPGLILPLSMSIAAGALRKRDLSYVYVPDHRVL